MTVEELAYRLWFEVSSSGGQQLVLKDYWRDWGVPACASLDVPPEHFRAPYLAAAQRMLAKPEVLV